MPTPVPQPPSIRANDFIVDPGEAGGAYDGTAVVCIGTFDGVHRGHQAILAHAKALARAEDQSLVVVTFHPHPKTVVAPDRAPNLLTDPDEKCTLLRAHGADHVVTMRFDEALAATPAEEFAETIIRQQLRASAVVFGDDFRFGHGREGTPEFMRQWGAKTSIQVEMVEAVTDDQLGQRISSSIIRKLLTTNGFNDAIRLLGHAWPVSGEIVTGAQRGRTLGYPTWNLVPSALKFPPPVGIFAGWAGRASPRPAMAYYGSNPTFGGTTPKLEANLFSSPEDAAPEAIETVWLSAMIREEVVFDSADALKRQLADDERVARDMLLTGVSNQPSS